MTTQWSRDLVKVARRSLSRQFDENPLPEYYLHALSQWLALYPDEDYFLVDLSETPPVVTCLDCFEDIRLNFAQVDAIDLLSFESHTKTSNHASSSANRKGKSVSNSQHISSNRAHVSQQGVTMDQVEDDHISIHDSGSSVPTTPDSSFEPLPDEILSSGSGPGLNARVAGKKRASSSSLHSHRLDLSEDEDIAPKRAKTANSLDLWNDDDDDAWMSEIPTDFWKPVVVSKRDEREVELRENEGSNTALTKKPKANRTSGVLAALNNLAPVASSSGVSHRVKPEPDREPRLWNHVKPEPEDDIKPLPWSTPDRKPVKTESRLRNLVKPEPEDDIKPLPWSTPGKEPLKTKAFLEQKPFDAPGSKPLPDDGIHNRTPLRPHSPVLSMPLPVVSPRATPQVPNRNMRDLGGLFPAAAEHNDGRAELNEFLSRGLDDLAETSGVQDALKKLNLASLNSKLRGMDTTLLPHQVIGVAWMNKVELSKYKGGILADEMGLGKTVQMIAAMCLNRPQNEDDPKTTLIVVPTSLLDQWRTEIENKTEEDTFSIFVHYGSQKLRRVKDVSKYDIVITTYTTLGADFAKIEREPGMRLADYIEDETRKTGALARTKFWRVILDEAQYIRNRQSIASINVSALDAVHRWTLTGTPVTNALADLYALIRFGHLRPWNDWSDFNEHIAKVQNRNPGLAGDRAQAMLKPYLLRRSKNSKVEGKPILELGPKTITVHKLEFSPRERQIYDAIEKRQQEKLNRILERGRLAKDYHFIFVMILRLRQAANHSQLISYVAGEFDMDVNRAMDDGDDLDPQTELDRAERVVGEDAVNKLKAKYVQRTREGLRAENENEVDEVECTICLEPIALNGRVTKCGHEFCAECIRDVFESPQLALPPDGSEENAARAKQPGLRPCPVCRTELKEQEVFLSAAFEPDEDIVQRLKNEIEQEDMDDEEADFLRINAKRRGGKPKPKTDVDGIDLADLDLHENFRPSTKMIKMVELLKEYEKSPIDGRVEKTILYSQWTSMIDLVEIQLKREGMKSVRYDGQMNRVARAEAVRSFKSRNGPNIMIISLKCGGVGLNLTEASRVISLDLAWNAATESQAFDRVHRLGQQLPVFVERLVVRNTIEDRIMSLQEKKQGLSDSALGEGTGKKLKRMGARELRALFGM